MLNYYHITLVPKPNADLDEIGRKINLAVDWFQYHEHCWIVYTDKDAEKWCLRLKPFALPGGELLVCKIDISDIQGWMDKSIWKWIADRQTEQKGEARSRRRAQD